MKKIRLFNLFIALSILFSFVACDNEQFIKSTKKTLWVNQHSWIELQNEAAELYHAGKITDKQWAEFVNIDKKYRATHNAAVEALELYIKTRDVDIQEKIALLIANVSDILKSTNDLIDAWKSPFPNKQSLKGGK